MPEASGTQTATPPANSGGLTLEQVNTAITTTLATALKPVTDTLTAIGQNQKVLADTLSALPPAKVEEKKDGSEGGASRKPAALTATDVAKVVEDAFKARDTAAAQAADKSAKVKSAIATHLGGDESFATVLANIPEDQLEATAKSLASKVTAAKPDVGGVKRDGGTPAAATAVDYSKLNASQKVDLGVKQLLAGSAK
jgi:carboxylesterase type B